MSHTPSINTIETIRRLESHAALKKSHAELLEAAKHAQKVLVYKYPVILARLTKAIAAAESSEAK